MKKIIIFLLKLVCCFLTFIYPYSIANKLKSIRNNNYTYWITTKFKYFGNLSVLAYPSTTILGEEYISIGRNVRFGARAILTAWDKYECDSFTPQIIIGDNVNIGEDCHITAINKIEIGNDVLMGKKITISDNSHGETDFDSLLIPPIKRRLFSKGPVVIENGVWIGDKATILAGVRIGRNSIIGANTLVTKNVPENCIVGGVPAKIIKKIVV